MAHSYRTDLSDQITGGGPGPIGGSGSASTSVILTNDEIIALPTIPIVVVPATESLGGSDFPTSLPIPTSAFAVLNASAGAYGDVVSGLIMLSYGANKGVAAAQAATATASGILRHFIAMFATRQGFQLFCLNDSDLSDGYLEDNSLVLWINNPGNLSGGNVANSMKVIVNYINYTLI